MTSDREDNVMGWKKTPTLQAPEWSSDTGKFIVGQVHEVQELGPFRISMLELEVAAALSRGCSAPQRQG